MLLVHGCVCFMANFEEHSDVLLTGPTQQDALGEVKLARVSGEASLQVQVENSQKYSRIIIKV